MRHVYECPLRWADLDLLGHVNNVVYVDYLQEARVDMLRVHAPDRRADDLAEGVVVVRHEVDYLSPLTFRFAPVRIECWVTEIRAASFTIAYEVVDDDPAGRTTYLRASTVLTPYVFGAERPRRLTVAERDSLALHLEPGERRERSRRAEVAGDRSSHYPVQVRFSDVDVYGHVNNVKYFEYLQEARIALLAGLARPDATGPGSGPGPGPGPRSLAGDVGLRTVVRRIEVDYHRPILFRREPYDLWTQVEHVGTTSVILASEIRDAAEVLSRARVVTVFWDPAAGRAAPPPAEVRARLLADAPPGGPAAG